MRLGTMLLVFSLAGCLMAQTADVPVKFDGQVRFRNEADGRDFNNDSDLNTYSLLRARLGASIQPLPDVKVYIQVQDSRAFGSEPGTLSSTANLDVHQAYFQLNNLWGKSVDLKVGRQEMIYAGQRLIGAVGWHNVGRAFDGVKLTFGKNNTLDVFNMIVTESSAASGVPSIGAESADFNFFGVYYKHRKKQGYKLDLYGLIESNLRETVPGEDDLGRVTLGSYAKGKLSGNFDFESELALQVGKRLGQDVSAFMLTGALGYTFASARKPHVSIGYDYLSGMDAGDTDYKVFDTLFATNHKFYGFMDYFLNVPAHTGGAGLQDFMVKGKLPLRSNLSLSGHFHNFRAAKGAEKNLGNELDFSLNYKYNAAVSAVWGLSVFMPGTLIEQRFANNNDVAVWSYTSLLVKF